MTRLFTNNAQSTLAGTCSAGATSLTVATGQGSRFPSPVSPDFFVVTLTQSGAETSWELVKVTAVSGDTFTIQKGQEGTADATWSAGSKVEIRFTAVEAQQAINVPYSGQSIIDFGPAPGATMVTATVIGQADLTPNVQISAWLMASTTVDHNATEHAVAPIRLTCGNIVPGVSFDIIAVADCRLTGQFACQWVRTL